MLRVSRRIILREMRLSATFITINGTLITINVGINYNKRIEMIVINCIFAKDNVKALSYSYCWYFNLLIQNTIFTRNKMLIRDRRFFSGLPCKITRIRF